MLRPFTISLLFCLTLALSAGAASTRHDPSTPHIYATSWGLTLSADGTGFYNDFAHFVLGPDDATTRYYVYPYKRAMRHFEHEKQACIYPKSIRALKRTGALPKNARIIESDRMMRSPLRVFTPPGTNPVRKAEDLGGMRIAYALGSNLARTVKAHGSHFVAISDETDKAKILLGSNVDAMLANMPDAYFVFQNLGVAMPPYDPAYLPVPAAHARIVCHDTKETRAFIKKLNGRIKTLVADNHMADFFKGQGLNPDEYMPRPKR